jgi:hypothetical protein
MSHTKALEALSVITSLGPDVLDRMNIMGLTEDGLLGPSIGAYLYAPFSVQALAT